MSPFTNDNGAVDVPKVTSYDYLPNPISIIVLEVA